jgi:hypothetical protein
MKPRKPKQNPPKDDCRCGAFCIEDTASTGRVCKLEKHRAAQKETDDFECGNAAWAASFIA